MTGTKEQRLDHAFAALAHPTRRTLLVRLGAGEQRVTELAAAFPIALNSVSKHLKVLEEAGLIRRRVAGRDHWLSADWAPASEALGWAERQRTHWRRSLDALADLVETPGAGRVRKGRSP